MTSDLPQGLPGQPGESAAGLVERHFQQLLAARCYQADAAQQQAIGQLARWLDGWLRGRAGWLRAPKAGVYLWGGVGRGKSFVMDAFFAAAPLAAKRRVHFHAFLHEIQLRLQQIGGQADPLATVAAEIATQTRLLCFDEFHVHDIGDAMLLGRLLRHLVDAGVGLVCTSNYPPAGLCPNPLYRDRFQPAIALLERRFAVLGLEGGEDYRQRAGYCWGDCAMLAEAAQGAWVAHQLGLDASAERDVTLLVNRRPLALLARQAQNAWLHFDVLCREPRASADFLWLAEAFHGLALSGVPRLDAQPIDVQQRFLNLIDILYDQGNYLLLVGEAPPEALLRDGGHVDFSRTRSRLQQLRRLPGVSPSC
ncbi:cell division protein ZapE [Pseudomonas sp. JM10B5a]|nr:cell division protein ZapE [Pseudomonas oligotrophica]MCF7203506.1 cell division protein ZapE [Pseudomonas oligotrophica]